MFKHSGVLKHVHRCFYSKSSQKFNSDLFKTSEEVLESLSKGAPVVALESTLITHGLPYPDNLRTACRLEAIVRENKATPATIGIIGGKVIVGMSLNELGALALKNKNLVKISRRDLPFVLSKGLSGGTTVAATMAIAYRAGIQIFVTGGIGGVHRGAETSMDISADLYELSRTPMTVVSAGVKSILDIGRTLEYLETLGVCVAKLGDTKEFPSFFTPGSKFSAACNVKTHEEAARLIDARDRLELESGILLAVPIPEEFYEDGNKTDYVIEDALNEARAKNVVGRDVTPFVLSKVRELSGGASLKANIGLLENNALEGSRIAVHLSALKSPRGGGSTSPRVMMSPVTHQAKNAFATCSRPVVIGGSVLDIHVKALEDFKVDGRTMSGRVESTAGGVGRNVADCLSRLGADPLLVSTAGAQEHAHALLSKMEHMDKSGIKIVSGARTATCIVVLDHRGECIFLIGDMGVHDTLSPEQIKVHETTISQAPLVIIDGNIPLNTIDYIFQLCSKYQIPVWFEPTDLTRAFRPFKASSKWRSVLSYASPNLTELKVMHSAVFGKDIALSAGSNDNLDDILQESLDLGVPLLKNQLHTLVVTLGAHGVVLITNLPSGAPFPIAQAQVPKETSIRAIHYTAPNVEKIVSVSGAGDCFAAGMIASLLRGQCADECVSCGLQAAALSLDSHIAVPHSIQPEEVFYTKRNSAINATVVYP